jgi:hypothetical protein
MIDRKKKRQMKQTNARKVGLGLRQGWPSASRPGLDPYKYSTWPESGTSVHQQDEPAVFADIIGDHFFDSSASNSTTNNSTFDDTDPTVGRRQSRG